LSRRAVDPIIKAYEKQAEFVQNASHELRTPLTIIQAKQEMLLQAPESKIIDKSEDIALTLSETRRLSKMATELMDLARADSNNSVINKSKIDLKELIKNYSIQKFYLLDMFSYTYHVECACVLNKRKVNNKL